MDFSDHYSDYYHHDDVRLTRWRRLGAVEKAANLVRLWAYATGEATVGNIVDVGCGDGALALQLSDLAFYRHLVGFDVSASGVEIAQAHGLSNAEFATYDGTTIPLDDASVDLAVLCHVIEHVAEPRGLIAEAARVARRIFVEVPLEAHLRQPRDYRWTDTGHINFYNPTLIRQLVQSVGLRVVAEAVTNPGRVAHEADRDHRSMARWRVKSLMLRVPPVATAVASYHGALIADHRAPTYQVSVSQERLPDPPRGSRRTNQAAAP